MTDSKRGIQPLSQHGRHPPGSARHPWPGIAGLLLMGLAVSLQAGAQSEPSAPQAGPSPLDSPYPWLDEVRAQREAWEAERAATREAQEQRRRINHPRGAAQQEIWEEDLRRRRAERQERIERDRERFHNLGPGPLPIPLPPVDPMRPEDPLERAAPQGPEATPYPPQGWNNLWYFRGF